MGYVEHADRRRYRLTDKLRQLGFNQSERRLISLARPVLQKLREQTGETVNLAVLRNNRVVYLATIESAHALRRVADADFVFSRGPMMARSFRSCSRRLH